MRRSRDRPGRESGYATVAAVVAVGFFALIALETTTNIRSALADVAAADSQARLTAAADAGLALAVHGLGIEDRTQRWTIDGRPYRQTIGPIALSITVEDERGKIPINWIQDDRIVRMFEEAGASDAQIETLLASFLDWRDGDDDRRPYGAEADDYAPRGIRPANGSFRSVDELAEIAGMTPAIFARIAPAATIFGGNFAFSETTAAPLAIVVMSPGGAGTPAYIQRMRELGGQRAALDIADDVDLVARPLTIRVRARDAAGASVERTTVVEFTGAARPAYVVRYVD